VTDSPLRDSEILASFGLAVYHRGVHPAQPSHRHVPYDSDVAVSVAGVTIEPGDLLVGDRDGIVVIPPLRATEVALAAATQEDEERFVARNVAAGESLTGLYPLGGEWRRAYEAQRESAG
jgi:regulator of RNase E activity RraA